MGQIHTFYNQAIIWHEIVPVFLKIYADLQEICSRGVSGGWAIAHPDFGRIEGPAGRCRGTSGMLHYYLPTQFYVASYAPDVEGVRGQKFVKFANG